MTPPGSAADAYAARTCSAPIARSHQMRDIVVARLTATGPLRLLDLGCGSGSLAWLLADALPAASVTGIDVSPSNIRAAIAQQAGRASAARVTFEVADYLAYRAGPFDAIVADGVLHLIPGDTDTLLRKIAGDLRAGGVFICSMPFDCLYNRAFALVRRILRAVRSPLVDAAILQTGRLLHGREMNDERLRERVDYMYIPPERMMNDALGRQFVSAGLQRAAELAMRSTSPSQLKHSATVFVRVAAR
jgi:trans-aconitate 2-methyltransferase